MIKNIQINDKVVCLGVNKSNIQKYNAMPHGCPESGQICCVNEVHSFPESDLQFVGIVGFPLINKLTGEPSAFNSDNFLLVGRPILRE